MKAECPTCHKVYQIPDERLPKGEEVAFPCPACKGIIKIGAGELLSGEALKARILKRVKDLPSMPQTILKAQETLSDANSSFEDVARVLEVDQAIATRILRMANSPFYGLSGKVSSIQHASAVLGYESLSEIIHLAGASNLLGNRLEGYGLDAGDLWLHSLGVAFGSKIIAKRKDPALGNDAFAAGLIHDAGKLALDPYILERKKTFEEYMAGGQRPFLSAEKEILGFDHQEIAYELCKTWRVPERLGVAIRFHHAPAKSQDNDLAYVVHLADAIAMMSGMGTGVDGMSYEMDDKALDHVGLQGDDITAIMVEVVESVETIKNQMVKA